MELTELKTGAENKLTVVADNSKLPNSRWYTGSGIYRPVWLYVCEKDGLRPESVKITTESIAPPMVRIDLPTSAKVEILDKDKVIGAGEGRRLTIELKGAKLWNAETPYLYTARIYEGEDITEIPFGIRQITWSNKGLFINGKETLLRGGCVHHDNGILGAATYAESEERRVRIMKENGFNAIRSSHNPASKALLDACDKLGIPGNNPMLDYLDIYYDILDEMKQEMTSVRQTASISRDFITQMIPHHRAAVEMCENALRYTISEPVSALAQTIIRQQTQGIAEMNAILCPCGTVCNGHREMCCYRQRNAQILNTMFSEMAHVSGVGVEQNFLREMVPHHEGAIRMSENALSFCICQSLHPILQNIIITQKQEISEMCQLLADME